MSVNNSCKLTNRNNLFNNAVPVFVRFVGWLKNFIHNRSLASENLMRGYNTTCMVRHMPPQALAALRSRVVNAPSYTKAGYAFPAIARWEKGLGCGHYYTFTAKQEEKSHCELA